MAVKKVKPVSNARRNMSKYTFEELTKGKKPEKRLLTKKKENAGRNAQGKLTVRHRGGGHKKRLRTIDYNRIQKLNIEGKVTAIEYDPNRTSYLMLVTYKDGDKRYHIAPEGIKEGDQVLCAIRAKIKKCKYQLRVKVISAEGGLRNFDFYTLIFTLNYYSFM